MTYSYEPAPQEPGALDLIGLVLHPVTVSDVHSYIESIIKKNQKALVLNLNIHAVNLALNHSWLHKFFRQAQLVFCDGDGVRWGLRCLGCRPPPKITYAAWIWELAEFASRKGYGLYFLGGKPGIASEAAERLKERHPALKIVGTEHGYFDKHGMENEKVLARMNGLRPDIVVVGFGMPMQEKWLMENWQRLDAHIFLTGGAVFDYASGRLKRAPAWMLSCHLEWLFRLCQEPRRLFARYVWGNFYFFFRIFIESLKSGKGGRHAQ